MELSKNRVFRELLYLYPLVQYIHSNNFFASRAIHLRINLQSFLLTFFCLLPSIFVITAIFYCPTIVHSYMSSPFQSSQLSVHFHVVLLLTSKLRISVTLINKGACNPLKHANTPWVNIQFDYHINYGSYNSLLYAYDVTVFYITWQYTSPYGFRHVAILPIAWNICLFLFGLLQSSYYNQVSLDRLYLDWLTVLVFLHLLIVLSLSYLSYKLKYVRNRYVCKENIIFYLLNVFELCFIN